MCYILFLISLEQCFVGDLCNLSLSYQPKSPVLLSIFLGLTSASLEKVVWPGTYVNNSFSACSDNNCNTLIFHGQLKLMERRYSLAQVMSLIKLIPLLQMVLVILNLCCCTPSLPPPGVLYKVLYREALPQGATPYSFTSLKEKVPLLYCFQNRYLSAYVKNSRPLK